MEDQNFQTGSEWFTTRVFWVSCGWPELCGSKGSPSDFKKKRQIPWVPWDPNSSGSSEYMALKITDVPKFHIFRVTMLTKQFQNLMWDNPPFLNRAKIRKTDCTRCGRLPRSRGLLRTVQCFGWKLERVSWQGQTAWIALKTMGKPSENGGLMVF